jgi:hypothetical protein
VTRASAKKLLTRAAAAFLAVCLAGEAADRASRGDDAAPPPLTAGECTVELWRATVPQPLSYVAVHCWFVVRRSNGRADRWEVWQNAGGTSWGHLHRNLMGPSSGVGGGNAEHIRTWTGEEARRLRDVLEEPEEYPHRRLYRAWPGPNSNTYVAWVLRRARVPWDMHPLAIGKDYRGLVVGAGTTTTRSGVQLESPLLGAKVGLKDGVEIHIIALTFGVDLWPPALKTPLGRLGIAER